MQKTNPERLAFAKTYLLFCDNVLDRKVVDADYAAEKAAAEAAGFRTALLSFEALQAGDAADAIRNVPPAPMGERLALYRGWMLRPEQYAHLADALAAKNYRLVTAPEAYKHCHYLPESYRHIEKYTAKSVWNAIEVEPTFSRLLREMEKLPPGPAILKDYVKSLKHHWEEACYIPDIRDFDKVVEVINRFLELRGEALEGGLVLREFVELEFLTQHSKSGMPLTLEYRLFFAENELIAVYPYWEEGDYAMEAPDFNRFGQVAKKIESPFFTMDVAKRKDGGWMIIELGDGQVAGLPDRADPQAFYAALASAFGR